MADQSDEIRRILNASSVLKATLDMLTADFDSMDSNEIREMVWLAKYEVDDLIGALTPNSIGRRIPSPESAASWLRRRAAEKTARLSINSLGEESGGIVASKGRA
jgi:hypothetical protein